MTTIDLGPELEGRLRRIAEREAVPVAELVGRILGAYLDAREEDEAAWIRASQARLARVWPAEDFSDWRPADA